MLLWAYNQRTKSPLSSRFKCVNNKYQTDSNYYCITYNLFLIRLNEIKVLVPGAGLGRLAFEIAVLGFKAQGNEFSLHMLMVSNFILNKYKL